MIVVLVAFSALAFTYYGAETLVAAGPRVEYDRYGLPSVRVFVGVMQLLGAAGLVVGIVIAPLGAVAAAGLTLMMLLGIMARLRINDAPRLMLPAAGLAILNALIFASYINY